MPHVVIEDAGDIGIACRGIKLTTVQNGSEILKAADLYLNRSSRTALVACAASIDAVVTSVASIFRRRQAALADTVLRITIITTILAGHALGEHRARAQGCHTVVAGRGAQVS